MNAFSRRKFMMSAAVAGGSAFLPQGVLANAFQDPVVDTVEEKGKSVSREKIPWKVRPFPMKQVRLGEGPCKQAMEADRRYLHSLPPDRLLHTFRINAGFPRLPSPWADGKLRTANCEVTTRAVTIFQRRPDVCQHRR